MRTRVRRRHEACVRAQSVCTEYSALFDATPGGQKVRASLAADVAELDRLLALQASSIEDRRAATEQCRLSRRILRNAARAVVSVGRLVDLDAAVMDTMRLPRARNDEELLAYSRALLERVSPYAGAFVTGGLPPDLLQRLGDGVAAFAAARDAQAGARQRFTAAYQSIRETLDHANKTIDVLDAIGVNTPAAPPELLITLRIARRVGPRVRQDERGPDDVRVARDSLYRGVDFPAARSFHRIVVRNNRSHGGVRACHEDDRSSRMVLPDLLRSKNNPDGSGGLACDEYRALLHQCSRERIGLGPDGVAKRASRGLVVHHL
jgi:hypothetical protein